MKVVSRQISGLGNQLFQYAAARYYSRQYGASLRLAIDPPQHAVSHGIYPRPFLLSHFSIPAPHAPVSFMDRLMLSQRRSLAGLKRAAGVQVYSESIEQRYTFLPELPLEKGVRLLLLLGYWQTYGTVDAVADELRADLRFRQAASGKNLEVLQQIEQCANPVSLHVRRGDYTLVAEGQRTLSPDYYARATAYFEQRLERPMFYVFSDDIAWARENLPGHIEAVFVDHNDDLSSHEDLRLMSACRHHIIANSSFSWWGAWLNPRPDKMVFAPKYWYLTPDSYYPDLLPPEWTLALP